MSHFTGALRPALTRPGAVHGAGRQPAQRVVCTLPFFSNRPETYTGSQLGKELKKGSKIALQNLMIHITQKETKVVEWAVKESIISANLTPETLLILKAIIIINNSTFNRMAVDALHATLPNAMRLPKRHHQIKELLLESTSQYYQHPHIREMIAAFLVAGHDHLREKFLQDLGANILQRTGILHADLAVFLHETAEKSARRAQDPTLADPERFRSTEALYHIARLYNPELRSALNETALHALDLYRTTRQKSSGAFSRRVFALPDPDRNPMFAEAHRQKARRELFKYSDAQKYVDEIVAQVESADNTAKIRMLLDLALSIEPTYRTKAGEVLHRLTRSAIPGTLRVGIQIALSQHHDGNIRNHAKEWLHFDSDTEAQRAFLELCAQLDPPA